MNAVLRWLRLDADRWRRIGPDSWWSALAIVLVAAVLVMLIRFGGIVGDAPRSALRLILVTVWGWLGLSAGVAVIVAPQLPTRRPDPRVTLAVVGLAHVPLLVMAAVTLVFGGMVEILGPGRVIAAFALSAWIPASLVVGVSVTCTLGLGRAAATVVAPYLAWLALTARHVMGQIEHLL